MRLYGIKTCPSVKKAKEFFDSNGIDYEFIDINKDNVSQDKIEYWLNFTEAKNLFNPRSKAYRDLNLKGANLNTKTKTKLLWEDNSLLKRPILEHGLNGEQKLHVGYDVEQYNETFLSK
jgi:Spx/MgsR family transcriptional regulator